MQDYPKGQSREDGPAPLRRAPVEATMPLSPARSVALVTGGSRGIGAAISRRLAASTTDGAAEKTARDAADHRTSRFLRPRIGRTAGEEQSRGSDDGDRLGLHWASPAF